MAEPAAPYRSGTRLTVDGFVLRRWRRQDLDSPVRHANDERVARGSSDRFPFPYAGADDEVFLAGHVIGLADPVFAPWVMAELALLRLQATVLDTNPASAQVLLNNGFIEEGVQRSAVVEYGQVRDLRMYSRISQPHASAA